MIRDRRPDFHQGFRDGSWFWFKMLEAYGLLGDRFVNLTCSHSSWFDSDNCSQWKAGDASVSWLLLYSTCLRVPFHDQKGCDIYYFTKSMSRKLSNCGYSRQPIRSLWCTTRTSHESSVDEPRKGFLLTLLKQAAYDESRGALPGPIATFDT